MACSNKMLGIIVDENEMAGIYSLSDVLLVPSRQESFGYIVSEALACHIPVVAFAIGSILDQIQHKKWLFS